MCRSVCLGVLERGIGSLEMQLSRHTRDTSASLFSPAPEPHPTVRFLGSVSSGSFAPAFNPSAISAPPPPPKRAFLAVVHGRTGTGSTFFVFLSTPTVCPVSSSSSPPPPRAFLERSPRRTSPASVLEASPKPDFFSGGRKKRDTTQGSHAASHSYWPVNATLTFPARKLKNFAVRCRTWRQVAGM